MMNRMNFGTLSGAIIDVCRGHGTFLDAGELHQIVTFIQQGGLDRARAREKIERAARRGAQPARPANAQGRRRELRRTRGGQSPMRSDDRRRAGTIAGTRSS